MPRRCVWYRPDVIRRVVPFSISRSTRSPDGRPPTTSVMSRAGTVREPSASILPGTQAVMPISRLVAVSFRPASSVRSSTLASTGRELRPLTARLTTDRPRARFSCITESFTSGLPAPRYRVGIFSSRHHHHGVDGVDDRSSARSWAERQGWPRSTVDRWTSVGTDVGQAGRCRGRSHRCVHTRRRHITRRPTQRDRRRPRSAMRSGPSRRRARSPPSVHSTPGDRRRSTASTTGGVGRRPLHTHAPGRCPCPRRAAARR